MKEKVPEKKRGSKEKAGKGNAEIAAEVKTERKRSAPKRTKKTAESKKAEVVEGLIKSIELKLEKGDLKPTVGDFLRLLQFQRELEDGEPREVKVQWVEPTETESENKT